jgi:hypothetical protein
MGSFKSYFPSSLYRPRVSSRTACQGVDTSTTTARSKFVHPAANFTAHSAQEFDLSYFLKGALAGGICCSVTHGALTPVDVVKTRMQLEPLKYTGMVSGFQKVIAEEGAGALLTGLGPTAFGYFVQGWFKFGGVEYFKVQVRPWSFNPNQCLSIMPFNPNQSQSIMPFNNAFQSNSIQLDPNRSQSIPIDPNRSRLSVCLPTTDTFFLGIRRPRN